MQPYTPEMKAGMKKFYESLNEKDRRRYAGIEALKLGLGGRDYIARVSKWVVRQGNGGTHSRSGRGAQALYA